jgi:serine/threonine protein kinase
MMTSIGSYRILSPLGRGGMGEVYLAEDTRLGRKVAIKLLLEEFTTDGERVRRFEREARAASAINHPNILTIYEIGRSEGLHFIAAEYVEGQTLRQRMKQSRLRLREALDVAIQVASALNAAHTAAIIHRDVKPENIMVRPDGLVKVLDFGLAKLTERRATACDTQVSTIAGRTTELGVVMGTARYMSPEQARGLEVDARTDIFSLGVVIYEMMAGCAPFEGATTNDVIAAILKTEPPPLVFHVPEVSGEIENVISKALRKEREERYQVVKDLLLDLKNYKKEMETKAAGADQPILRSGATAISSGMQVGAEPLVNAITRRKGGLVLALASLAVVVAAIVYLAPWIQQKFQADQPPPQRKLWQLTFDPGLQSEPSWSPDGRFIAYSSDRGGNFDIWVQQVNGGNPVQVTKSPAHDWQPSWSPNGHSLVFRSERDGGGLFVVPALGGSERKVSSFGYRPRWSPDSSQILFYSSVLQTWIMETSKVYVVGLDGTPPAEALAEFLADFLLLQMDWHTDGRRISFWGRHRKHGWGFWTAPVADGVPIKSELAPQVEQQMKEAAVSFINFRWSPTGQLLYFEGIAQSVRNLWRIEVEPQTLRWVAGPERLTTDAGLDTNIAPSPDGRKLAYTVRTERTRIWSLPFDAATGRVKGAGQPITEKGRDAWQPDLSRDGRKLVFRTQRAGKQELWEQSLADGHSTLLMAADEFSRHDPRWSPDGLRLAYERSRPSNPERTRFEYSIVLLFSGGGEEQAITSASASFAVDFDWATNGERLLGSCNHQAPIRAAICLFPLSAAPRVETQMRVVTSHPDYDLWQARFSPDERWISFNAVSATDTGVSTIYVVPASGGEWRRITEGKYRDSKGRWSPDGKAIYFVSSRAGFFNIWGIRFDPTAGEPVGAPFRVTAFDSPGQILSPDVNLIQTALTADRFVLPIMEVSGNIWILENVDR